MFNRQPIKCEGTPKGLPCWRTSTHGVRNHEGKTLCEQCIRDTYVGRQVKVGDWMWERLVYVRDTSRYGPEVVWRRCTVVHVGEGTLTITYEHQGKAENKVLRLPMEHPLKFNLDVGDRPLPGSSF